MSALGPCPACDRTIRGRWPCSRCEDAGVVQCAGEGEERGIAIRRLRPSDTWLVEWWGPVGGRLRFTTEIEARIAYERHAFALDLPVEDWTGGDDDDSERVTASPSDFHPRRPNADLTLGGDGGGPAGSSVVAHGRAR